MLAFHSLALATLVQKGTDQGISGISEGTAIIVGGIGAAILAAVFQTLGAFLINYLSARREDRAASRESERRKEQWDREDELRREEQQKAAEQQRQARRAEAYRKFAAATAFRMPLDEDRRTEQLAKLTEAHTEIQAYGSADVREEASSLYSRAFSALYDDTNVEAVRRDLDNYRGFFWDSISRRWKKKSGDRPLFTRRRRTVFLGSSYPGSCIAPVQTPKPPPVFTHAL